MQSGAEKASVKKKNVLSEAERREMVMQGLARKKECEAKAQAVVQRLSLTDLNDREWFRDAAFYLNHNYYSDIVDERHCSKLCGYPLCSKPPSEKLSKQKFHISTKLNRVFDVTERKKFCSNECFKASMFYKDQLLTSPLWLREQEAKVKVKFQDEINSEILPGHGEEVVFSDYYKISQEVRAEKSEAVNPEVSNAKLPEFNNDSVKESGHKLSDLSCPESERLSQNGSQESERKLERRRCEADQTPEAGGVANFDQLTLEEGGKMDEKEDSSRLAGDNNSESSESVKLPARQTRTKFNLEERLPDLPPLTKVTKSIQEWFTVESVRMIYGNQFLKKLLLENDLTAPVLPDDDEIQRKEIPDEISPEMKARYVRLCRQLDLLEIQDSRDDMDVLTEEASLGPRKKLPDYEQLKKDAEEQKLKIGSYFKGKTDFEVSSGETTSGSEKSERFFTMPLVDKHAQGALRRRIVNEQLDRVFPDLLKLFGLLRRDISDQLRKLVFSFDLGPENILLKPQEWTLAAIILLMLICRYDAKIEAELSSMQAKKYLSLMLLGYGTTIAYIEQFLESLHSDFTLLIRKMRQS